MVQYVKIIKGFADIQNLAEASIYFAKDKYIHIYL